MSYTALQSLGALGLGTLCPSAPNQAGQAVASCDGAQMATNCDACCPTSTFNVATYRSLKSKQSLRYWNEKRVARAFQILTSPTISGGSSLLEEFAYDENLPVPLGLQGRIVTAARYFGLLFPLDRYIKEANCKETDCTPSGYYSCWKEQPPVATPERLTAVARVAGVSVPASVYQQSGYANMKLANMSIGPWAKFGTPVPPAYQAWCSKIVAAIDGVLGGSGGDKAQRLLPMDTPDDRFFEVSGGAVVPQPWLARLLGALTPAPMVMSTSLQKLTATKPKLSIIPTRLTATVPVSTSAAASSSRATADTRRAPPDSGDGLPVALVAVGALGLAAVGLWVVKSPRG